MPNWCENRLDIRGPLEEVDAFIARAQGRGPSYLEVSTVHSIRKEDLIKKMEDHRPNSGDLETLCFNSFAPVPLEMQRLPYDDFAASSLSIRYPELLLPSMGGYTWQTQNWGTKWGAGSVEIELSPNGVSLMFDTAWSPPIEVVKAMATLFPALTFTLKYEERGNWFAGKDVWEGGAHTLSESTEPEPWPEDTEDTEDT